MKVLMLQIKAEWLAKIESGEKTIDYRDCTDFWITRLVEDVLNPDEENEEIIFTKFACVKFLCGKKVVVKNHVKTELDVENGCFNIHIS